MNACIDRKLAREPDVLAPDESEIRLLAETPRTSMCHARLPAGRITAAVRHRTVDEVWYCLSGIGEIWRSFEGAETIVTLAAGCSIALPCGTAFQWRNRSSVPLDVLIATTPPWPGADEAQFVSGTWSLREDPT